VNEKKYNENGYLIISEMDTCPFWEKDTVPSIFGCTQDCFYCRFTDFRTEKTITRAQQVPRGSKLYSICQNEKNRRKESLKEDKNED
jgi:hypothetical protein